MALALNNLKRFDMPLNKETKPSLSLPDGTPKKEYRLYRLKDSNQNHEENAGSNLIISRGYFRNLTITLIFVLLFIMYSTPWEFFTPDFHKCFYFHWCLSNSKSPEISRTFLSFLPNFNIAVVWMVSVLPLIPYSPYLFSKFLWGSFKISNYD